MEWGMYDWRKCEEMSWKIEFQLFTVDPKLPYSYRYITRSNQSSLYSLVWTCKMLVQTKHRIGASFELNIGGIGRTSRLVLTHPPFEPELERRLGQKSWGFLNIFFFKLHLERQLEWGSLEFIFNPLFELSLEGELERWPIQTKKTLNLRWGLEKYDFFQTSLGVSLWLLILFVLLI
jgi:hypothetical protein